MSSRTVIVLTLEEHKDGVWITRLLHALSPQVETSVVTLESLLQNFNPAAAAAPLFPPSCCLVINRVSDAAPPHLQKACVAVLQVAVSLQSMPVFNGPVSYGLCTNKWCHHVLFDKAGLCCPCTRAVLEPTATTLQEATKDVGISMRMSSGPLLLKPNAGGFGTGVRRIMTANLNNDDVEHAFSYSDKMALIQEYVESDLQYRVWFLKGKVQCGIAQTCKGNFASACVGSACTLQSTARAIAIPDDVRDELEQGLLPLLPDAHAGSVEFLLDKADTRRRLYFDLNLLSTLPQVERVQDAESVWGKDFDPWKEMANAIMDMIH